MKTYTITVLILGTLACLAVPVTGIVRNAPPVTAALVGTGIGIAVVLASMLIAVVIDTRRNR